MIKRDKNIAKRFLAIMLVSAVMLLSLASCSQGSSAPDTASADESGKLMINTSADLKTAKIGVQLGTVGDLKTEQYEETGAVIEKYNKGADAVQALIKGKIDCVVIDENPAKAFVEKNNGLKILDEALVNDEYAICIAKENTELLEKVNSALDTLKSNGTLDKIIGNYIGDAKGSYKYTSPEGTSRKNGKLVMATNAEFEPYEYRESGEIVGIDADMAQAIADILEMELQIDDVQFDSIVPAVSSGKADMGVAGMSITEDRLKNVNFSNPYTTSKQVIIVRKDNTTADENKSKVKSVKDLETAKIGVQLGTVGDLETEQYEETGAVIEKYNKGADAVQALIKGKIDCVVIDENPAKAFVEKNNGLKILDEALVNDEYAICIAKENTELLEKVNSALDTLKSDGTLDKIIGNYIGDAKGSYKYTSPEGTSRKNGKLVMATNAEFEPYEYRESGEIVGIDADMAQAIADILEMELQIDDVQFDSIVPAVSSGKADMGVAGMSITEDRLKNVNFSNPYTTSKQVIIVKSDEVVSSNGFGDKLYNNFIKDDRWKNITNGLVTTLEISLFAALLGAILGFIIAIGRVSCDRTGKCRLINWFLKLYLTVIRGTPAMIQLLIIYYVIFASSSINNVFVAIIAFGLNSSAYVAEIVRSGINSVDEGQFEAGRSLGFSYTQTMINFILPQAVKNILPALGNELIVLIKETSIAGYIGIVDLTKAGDIIRSRTYDAFLPLIAVALVYLVIVVALTAVFSRMEKRLKKDAK